MSDRPWGRPRARRWIPDVIGGAILSLAALSAPLHGQGIWPDRAENLQVLPADLPPDQLRDIMRGFTQALGVRCNHCHVGEANTPLSQYDFVSDAIPAKETARRMLVMLGDIDGHLEPVESTGPVTHQMGCRTCHAGKPRPLTLQETLLEIRLREGGDAVPARFTALRERFYGGNQYDFRPPGVDAVGDAFLAEGDTATALALFRLNRENHPEWMPAYERLGDLFQLRGESDEAARWYRRGLELAPDHPRLMEKLAALGGG